MEKQVLGMCVCAHVCERVCVWLCVYGCVCVCVCMCVFVWEKKRDILMLWKFMIRGNLKKGGISWFWIVGFGSENFFSKNAKSK